MKITLAFTIFNKEKWIKSLLKSWVSNLSGKNSYEIIIVFDACKDRSEEIARKYLDSTKIKYRFFYANDRFEIYCNNLALKHATGDYIIFIQDDNWIYDKNWDLILAKVVNSVPNVGAIGFLAGLKVEASNSFWQRLFLTPNSVLYERIEVDRLHKGKYFNKDLKGKYQAAVWQVDAINRPFCISRKLLLSMGGLNKKFMPSCGDDLDLSLKLLEAGRVNVYIPFDLLNVTASNNTLSQKFITDSYTKAYSLNFKLHKKYLTRSKSIVLKLGPWGRYVDSDTRG